MIYTVTLNPAVDKTVEIEGLVTGGVNRTVSERSDAGGKGVNVSRVIKALGGESVALGVIGGSTGDFIERSLNAAGIDTAFTRVSAETRVNLKIIDTLNGVNTDVNERGAAVSAETLKSVEDELRSRLAKGDCVVLAGSVPRGAPVDIYARLIRLVNSFEATAVLDADGPLLTEGLKAKPFLIKPNIDELSRITGKKLVTALDCAREGVKLCRQSADRAIVSLGGDGAVFCTAAGAYHAHGVKVPVRSTVGAGDSMVAAVCLALQRGYGEGETISLAVAASAASVTVGGTEPAELTLVQELENKVSWEKIL